MRSAEFQLVDPETSLLEAERDPQSQLKRQVAERLAAHRSRQGRAAGPTPVAPVKSSAHGRANRIAAAVAERYAQSPSYREFLAAEAQRAIDEADAAAEIAARNAHAINIAQQQLLEELENWNTPLEPQLVPSPFVINPEPAAESAAWEPASSQPALQPSPRNAALPAPEPTEFIFPEPNAPLPAARPTAGLTVRHYESEAAALRATHSPLPAAPRATPAVESAEEEERWALDEEIAFRHTPGIAEPPTPPIALPANLIEFPRQLVAPRKSRPRHAEGPLREESDSSPAAAQLRIFEVEATQISSTPAVESALPEWSSIHLDPAPAAHPVAHESTALFTPPQPAAISLRLMAATVDACLLGTAFFAFVAAAAVTTNELPTGLTAVTASAGTLFVLFLFYRTLFFTFSDATPGMRYARIGLCTFSDDNPTRSAMRRRTWAILLSGCSLGIGCLWALLDDDRMSWHDRISRMYQRSY